MRSGWNSSSASSFSPTDANRIGLPVTARTESAAPPRASPSSFVRITPSKSTASLELLGDVDGVLAGHRVEHHQHVVRLGRVAHAHELVHQVAVDVQAAGGVDDHDVAALRGRGLDAVARDRDRIAARAALEDRHVDLPAERLELLDGGGALQVAGHERRLQALLGEQVRELAGRGRLARALQAAEQDHRRRLGGHRELRAGRAEQLGELLVDDLHDLLAGRQARERPPARRSARARRRRTS